ncbi:DEAD/DEAH box helicase [Candidatus Accumulibacter phosphatis]|uniref:DEAD/DEAH box helicase n=1 Tax=Candidatus Accumulibacter phosphatis TaxID=327160 RepID=A0ABX1TTD9_9PROT|nr:DEAD/DEAH box helicase [Candidatus Accumulibacter phosphatis]
MRFSYTRPSPVANAIRAPTVSLECRDVEIDAARRCLPAPAGSDQGIATKDEARHGSSPQDRPLGTEGKPVLTRAAFGKTWWGEQWLDALTHIDYDNRLPRGRSYANKGAVRNLTVSGGTIAASVKGSRLRPYRVSIAVPPIAAGDLARLLERIAADPALIAGMLNGKLDPAVLALASELGIAVFPTRWQDLAMDCSCPDWAVPCKHLAAAIYLLSREIDGNPFLVFSLRGFDLATALKARGIYLDDDAGAALPTLSELLPTGDDRAGADSGADSVLLDSLDFSVLPELSEALLRVLPERPPFFANGDFRATLSRALARVAKTARQALDTVPGDETGNGDQSGHGDGTGTGTAAARLSPDDRPLLLLDATHKLTLSGVAGIGDWPHLVAALAELAPARLPDFQPELAALQPLRLLALHLLARGAVVPQLFTLRGQEVGLRWLPANLDPAVRALMQRVEAALPPGRVMLHQGRKTLPLSAAAQATVLCSLFLDHFIRAWSAADRDKAAGDKTLALFFASGRALYDGPGEGSIAAGIHAWLARFHLARREHAPVLCLAAGEGGDEESSPQHENSNDGDHFSLSLAAESGATLQPPVALATVLDDAAWAQARFGVLQTVALLAEFYPPLNAYVSAGARTPLRIAADALPEFLFATLPVVRLLGIRALLPKALERLLRPRLSLQLKGQAGQAAGGGFLNADDVFGFDWRVAVGDQLLSREEFENLVRDATGVIRFKAGYVYLDPNEIERLRAQLARPPALSGSELLRAALAGEYAAAPIGLDEGAQRLLQQLREADDVELPGTVLATLRPYQQRGYAWLYRNARLGFGSVIADDMGLGKTLQVIATLQKLRDDGALAEAKALVIVPTSLLTNWQKEIARFAPALSVAVFHGARRELAIRQGEQRPDVLLTTYGIARSEAAALKALAWQVLVVDEAQNIKNPATAQTRAVKAIPASSFIAMSGTPVENRLSEYWSIMDFANRGYLGKLPQFVKEYALPIQTHRDQQVIERFRRVTAPFLLRRLKSDKTIIDDLPDKIEQDQYCSLSAAQSALYESVVQEGLRVIAGESDTFRRQGLVLQMILALKQICNHPAQYLKQGQEGGQERTQEAGQERTAAALSGKAERFLELIDAIHASHGKVLVFTQFREMGELLAGWLRERYAREPLFLHGGLTRSRRDALVERFQNDRTEQVFLLSLKAGGTGLNLTAASSVIHYDLWWNPAVEAQATDRAYRIGQQQNVQVHRLITRATFEERINDMIRAKRELAELTVGSGEQWIGQLGGDELAALFTLH